MQKNTAISVRNIDKVYKLYNRPSDRLKESLVPFGRKKHKRFTALENVSLKINRGETVGVIGRNGSGKSTLLQIISGVLKQTSGTVEVKGRVSALLELGAGFNPEFTGKQNAYINAAILGLNKSEIDAIFPDIVKFAEIGSFIYHPVKVYSSGMYVRLAFAVAISVNPEILVIDEALAVGDTLFQAKCFEKFREFQKNGVTILFVTHALEMVPSVCSSAYLLEKGRVVANGNPKKVVDAYNRLLAYDDEEIVLQEHNIEKESSDIKVNDKDNRKGDLDQLAVESRYGNGKAQILEGGIFSLSGHQEKVMTKGEFYEFRIKVKFETDVSSPIFAYTIKDVKGFSIAGSNTLFQKIKTQNAKPGEIYEIRFKQKMILNQGAYLLSFGCTGFENGKFVVYERRYDYMAFEVISDKSGVGFLDMDPEINIKKLK